MANRYECLAEPRRAWALRRAAQGALLALLAPAGWLLLRVSDGVPPRIELGEDGGLYLYMWLASALVLISFGALLGRREEQLLDANARLDALSVTDELTGLRNLRYFRARLDEAYARTEREQLPLAVAIIDLDRFKAVNDRHGHLAGDEVLKCAARAIARVVRKGETAARVGGEEFALLLPGSDAAAAERVAERIRSSIRMARPATTEPFEVTASVGVATTRELGRVGAAAIYDAADHALLRAKKAGRDRVVVAASGPSRPSTPAATPLPVLGSVDRG